MGVNIFEIPAALRDFFRDLFSGDPVALAMVLGLLVIALVVGCLWYKARRDRIRDEEKRKRRWYGGKKKE